MDGIDFKKLYDKCMQGTPTSLFTSPNNWACLLSKIIFSFHFLKSMFISNHEYGDEKLV